MSSMATDSPTPAAESDVLDVVVVGGGPHALVLCARLHALGSNAAVDTMTDSEKLRASIWARRLGVGGHKSRLSVRVIDPAGTFMDAWRRNFSAMGIQFLRSPSFVHPDPFDADGLRAHAFRTGRLGPAHLKPIPHIFDAVAVRGRSKREQRQLRLNHSVREQFVLPSSELFLDFCAHLVSSHRLSTCVHTDTVTDVAQEAADEVKGEPDEAQDGNVLYTVSMASGATLRARNVVLAIGAGSRPRLPAWLRGMDTHAIASVPAHALLHTYEIPVLGMPGDATVNLDTCDAATALRGRSHVGVSIESLFHGKRVVIVGGGLSSAHLTLQARALGATSVRLLHRRTLSARPFDLKEEWFSRERPNLLASYWSLPIPERFEHVRALRNGGSMPAALLDELRRACVESRPGTSTCVSVHEQCEVAAARFDACVWTIHTSKGDVWEADVMLLATGIQPAFTEEPCVRGLVRALRPPVYECPHTHACVPVLTHDLRLAEGANVFVMGAYAALQLGPDALNVAGGVAGARRIADALLASVKADTRTLSHTHARTHTDAEEGRGGEETPKRRQQLASSLARLLGGDGNMFAALSDDAD